MATYSKKMLPLVMILSCIILAKGNSMSGRFDSCNIECSNDNTDTDNNPFPNHHPQTASFQRGKSGPRGEKGTRGQVGVKGEPGVSCNRSEIEQLQNRISQLESDLANKTCKDAIPPSQKPELCGAGIRTHEIEDNQITASSEMQADHGTRHGRLFSTTGIGAWCPRHASANEWIQVDLEEYRTIYGVVTQGCVVGDYWLTSFKVAYRKGNDYRPIVDGSGETFVFQGNEDRDTPVVNNFAQPVRGRYFRITVHSWQNHPCLRFDLLTC